MTLHPWKCPSCGKLFRKALPPIHCGCGLTDTTGEYLVGLNSSQRAEVDAAVAKRFITAVTRWIAAGCPERTDEQVDAILRDHCSPCPLFVDSRCTHQQCGCQVRSSKGEKIPLIGWLLPRGMLNKLRMATEKCPDGKWS